MRPLAMTATVIALWSTVPFAQSNAPPVTHRMLRPTEAESEKVPKGYVEVKGAELPQYVVWRSVFRLLGRADRDRYGPSPFLAFVPLSEPERVKLLQVAIRSAAAEAQSQQRQIEKLREMESAGMVWMDKKHYPLMSQALYDLDYPQRVSTLTERDAFLEKLNPEARVALELWAQEYSLGISVTVHESELARFRAPN